MSTEFATFLLLSPLFSCNAKLSELLNRQTSATIMYASSLLSFVAAFLIFLFGPDFLP